MVAICGHGGLWKHLNPIDVPGHLLPDVGRKRSFPGHLGRGGHDDGLERALGLGPLVQHELTWKPNHPGLDDWLFSDGFGSSRRWARPQQDP